LVSSLAALVVSSLHRARRHLRCPPADPAHAASSLAALPASSPHRARCHFLSPRADRARAFSSLVALAASSLHRARRHLRLTRADPPFASCSLAALAAFSRAATIVPRALIAVTALPLRRFSGCGSGQRVHDIVGGSLVSRRRPLDSRRTTGAG
jgi:hypothetical protein